MILAEIALQTLKRVRRTAFIAALPSVAACQGGNHRNPTPEEQARWRRDTAKYIQDSTKWARDSIVRDSISRSINTDSLYRLYHRMLAASEPVSIMFLVRCEEGRLPWRYGVEPATAAMTRMNDTLWRSDEREAANRMWDKIRDMSVGEMAGQGVNNVKCGWPRPKMAESYRGTNLVFIDPRPVAPKRP